jgi:hypothetical protein
MTSVEGRPSVRPLRRLAVGAGIVALFLASLYTHFIVFAIRSQDCTVGFDTSTVPPPAEASAQGWLCGEQASTWGQVIWVGGFLLSLTGTVAFIVFAWRRWSWRAGLPALTLVLLSPVATSWVLNLPSDDCTAKTRLAHADGRCVRG